MLYIQAMTTSLLRKNLNPGAIAEPLSKMVLCGTMQVISFISKIGR